MSLISRLVHSASLLSRAGNIECIREQPFLYIHVFNNWSMDQRQECASIVWIQVGAGEALAVGSHEFHVTRKGPDRTFLIVNEGCFDLAGVLRSGSVHVSSVVFE
jgi:hypothetical protein